MNLPYKTQASPKLCVTGAIGTWFPWQTNRQKQLKNKTEKKGLIRNESTLFFLEWKKGR